MKARLLEAEAACRTADLLSKLFPWLTYISCVCTKKIDKVLDSFDHENVKKVFNCSVSLFILYRYIYIPYTLVVEQQQQKLLDDTNFSRVLESSFLINSFSRAAQQQQQQSSTQQQTRGR